MNSSMKQLSPLSLTLSWKFKRKSVGHMIHVAVNNPPVWSNISQLWRLSLWLVRGERIVSSFPVRTSCDGMFIQVWQRHKRKETKKLPSFTVNVYNSDVWRFGSSVSFGIWNRLFISSVVCSGHVKRWFSLLKDAAEKINQLTTEGRLAKSIHGTLEHQHELSEIRHCSCLQGRSKLFAVTEQAVVLTP